MQKGVATANTRRNEKRSFDLVPLLTSFLERFRILTVGVIYIKSDRPSSWYRLLLLKFKDNNFWRRIVNDCYYLRPQGQICFLPHLFHPLTIPGLTSGKFFSMIHRMAAMKFLLFRAISMSKSTKSSGNHEEGIRKLRGVQGQH